MEIKLSARLEAVASLVLPGFSAADIGTDHAYLAVYLVVNGICPFVAATDRVRGPLSSAKQLVDLLSLNKQIAVRLGEGLTVLKPGEAQTICIAGMGGYTVRDILAKSPQILASARRLVLQPQSNVSAVRGFLSENGWCIIAENIVYDSGFYYEIMAAEKGEMSLSAHEKEFGPLLISKPHPLLRPYLTLKKIDLDSLITELEALEDDSGNVQKRRFELLKKQQRIMSILSELEDEEE